MIKKNIAYILIILTIFVLCFIVFMLPKQIYVLLLSDEERLLYSKISDKEISINYDSSLSTNVIYYKNIKIATRNCRGYFDFPRVDVFIDNQLTYSVSNQDSHLSSLICEDMIDYYKKQDQIREKIERENHKQIVLKQQENLRNNLNKIQ